MPSIFSRGDRNRRDKILCDRMTENPFPGRPATATPDNPPLKLLGRDEEVGKLKEQIVNTAKTGNRPLIIIQGETGMGKSALTSYIFNKIVKGDLDEEELNVYGVFIEAYGEVKDFRLQNFYTQIIKSLDKYDQLPKIVARMVQFFGRLARDANQGYFEKLFENWNPDEHLDQTIQHLNDPLRARKLVDAIEAIVSIYLATIKRYWKSADTALIRVLLHSQAAIKERVEAIEALKTGGKYSSFSVSTNGDARQVLNALMDLLIAIEARSVMVMFIDQLEELFEIQEPRKISMKIFTLLLTLRQIPNLMIVLSGNNQAYKHLLDNLQGDAKEQIEQWHNYLFLPRLSGDNVSLIVFELLVDYWKKYDMSPDRNNVYYPLSQKTVIYLYEKHDRNLRRTLIGLHDIFNSFKENEEVKDLTDPIKAIGDLQIIHNPTILPLQIQRDFADYLTKSDELQDLTRSRIPELGIYNLFKVLYKEGQAISNLGMSIKRPKSGRKPDIYYRLGGNLIHSDARDIGIEVKCYRRQEYVSRPNVEKTVELLRKGDLHYIIWITNVELHPQTLASLEKEVKERQIGIVPRTDEQMAYIYWAYIFENALGRKPTLEEAVEILKKIGIPEVFYTEPSKIIELERERRLLNEGKRAVQPIEKEVEQIAGIVGQTTLEQFGIDHHDMTRSFILKRIQELKGMGRKQIRKVKLYEEYLESNNLKDSEKMEAEFIEILETTGKSSGDYTTTKALVKLKK